MLAFSAEMALPIEFFVELSYANLPLVYLAFCQEINLLFSGISWPEVG